MTEVIHNQSCKRAASRVRDVCTYIRFRIERPIKYITAWYQRDCSNIAAKQRESSANWTPEMRASFVMQIPSAVLAEKRNGSREKKRGIRVADFSNLSETPAPL